ncbi:hypothetical protein ccbrp13_24420 [Ktedonobacteria bacterium brp13]|nr:hypothetical protein ccbrp13_24420 [Ktedonobacteria bacterium brp13]
MGVPEVVAVLAATVCLLVGLKGEQEELFKVVLGLIMRTEGMHFARILHECNMSIRMQSRT